MLTTTLLLTIDSTDAITQQQTIQQIQSAPGVKLLLEGCYQLQDEPLNDHVFVEIHEDEEIPPFLVRADLTRIRELSSEEFDRLQSKGQVTAIRENYPRTRNRSILVESGLKHFGYIHCANLGFSPKAKMYTLARDSADDSPGTNFLQVEVPADLLQEIELTSLKVNNAIGNRLNFCGPYNLETALGEFSSVGTPELLDFLSRTTQQNPATFTPNITQRVEMANAMLAMRTVLEN